MIEIGAYSDLEVIKKTKAGFIIGERDGEQILLSEQNCPGAIEEGDKIKVYVYRDHNDIKIASCRKPLVDREEFAYLKIIDRIEDGMLMDWGMESPLLVPTDEQKQRMEVGEKHFVFLDIDEESRTFYGSTYIDEWLQNEEISLQVGDKVNVLIWRKTDLGYAVIVNHEHEGLIFTSDVYKPIEIGQQLEGYVKKIRPENKLDISLQPVGFKKANDKFTNVILDKLNAANGFLPFNDKSLPEDIKATFGMSKKAFKKAIGGLYKSRIILITSEGIKLVS